MPQAAKVGFTSIESEDDFEGIFFTQEPSVPPVGSAGNAVEVSRPMLMYAQFYTLSDAAEQWMSRRQEYQ